MSLPSGPRNTQRHAPPTFRSASQTTSDQPLGPNQRLSSSGLVNASKTSRRGASKTRVITTSRSVGVETINPPKFFIADLPQAQAYHAREAQASACVALVFAQ